MKKQILTAMMMATSLAGLAQTLNITVGDQTFTATLADNTTAEAFKTLLPLTLQMSELNGNEKYHYLSSSLPTNTVRPGTIHAGDIMLYGSTCVVLFYETFTSGYSYSRIGSIDNPTDLAQSLGDGGVTVTFSFSGNAGLSNVEVQHQADDDIRHTLSGARTTGPTMGVYLKNGKKYIKK